MSVRVRQAQAEDIQTVSGILSEAAKWLGESGMPMWRDGELTGKSISADVADGLFYIAESDLEPAGTIKFQLQDALFWPDVPQDESAFVHRLAIRRKFAGYGISSAMLQWAVDRAHTMDRKYLRLDCETARPRLREVYERFGFRHHSDRHVGPYFVARYEFVLK